MPSSKKVPQSVEEAVEILMEEVDNRNKLAIKQMDKDNLVDLHFGLGLYIRNNFIHGKNNEELLESCGSADMQRDDASMVIMEAFWERLQGKNLDDLQKDKIEDGLEDDNAFTALCKIASKNDWCWNIHCTTCGHMLFRYGFKELIKGKHPADEDWKIYEHDKQILDDLECLAPRQSPPLEEQKKLAQIFRNARLKEIKLSCDYPDWLGYLGLALYYTEDIEEKEQIFSEAWIFQLMMLMSPGGETAEYFKNKEVLKWEDLEKFER